MCPSGQFCIVYASVRDRSFPPGLVGLCKTPKITVLQNGKMSADLCLSFIAD